MMMPTIVVMVMRGVGVREDHRIEIGAARPTRPAMPFAWSQDHREEHDRH
jgi:hypothetical protein